MPTARLGDAERGRIRNDFSYALDRCTNSKAFPLGEEVDLKEWACSLLTPDIREKFIYLHNHCSELVRWGGGYQACLNIRSDEYEYAVNIRGTKIPYDGMLIPDGHETHADILEWAEWYYETYSGVGKSLRYLSHCLEYCHSIGQFKRVFPEEVLRFVPNWMQQTLAEAERRSRIPAGFERDEEKEQRLSNFLALASISPKEQLGIDASVPHRHRLCKEA